jgi:hypothetical protein
MAATQLRNNIAATLMRQAIWAQGGQPRAVACSNLMARGSHIQSIGYGLGTVKVHSEQDWYDHVDDEQVIRIHEEATACTYYVHVHM